MIKITVRGVLKTEPDGSRCWIGYVPLADTVEGILSSPVEMLDMEDGTGNYWVLAKGEAVPLLTTEDLDEIRDGELRRATIAKLTNEELAALGLTRT